MLSIFKTSGALLKLVSIYRDKYFLGCSTSEFWLYTLECIFYQLLAKYKFDFVIVIRNIGVAKMSQRVEHQVLEYGLATCHFHKAGSTIPTWIQANECDSMMQANSPGASKWAEIECDNTYICLLWAGTYNIPHPLLGPSSPSSLPWLNQTAISKVHQQIISYQWQVATDLLKWIHKHGLFCALESEQMKGWLTMWATWNIVHEDHPWSRRWEEGSYC